MATLEISAGSIRDEEYESQRQAIWRRFRRHRLAMLGVAALLFLMLFSFVGPLLSPYDANALLGAPNQPPSQAHLLGTDEIGRDILTRLMSAGRISLLLAVIVTLGTTLLGMLIGAVAGYFGGWVDSAAMRLVDFLLTLPALPMLLILSAMSLRGGLPLRPPEWLAGAFGWVWGMPPAAAESVLILAFILIALGWMEIARLVRGQVLSLRTLAFTEATRALGASHGRIILRHMIPNALGPIIVAATFGFGSVIIAEAGLSFLGFGVQNPSASWGNMLNNVREFMQVQPWRAFIPGLTIFIASLSFNFIGDALRDALDPRMKV
ncbi:MAG: ABC transporter permease [Chloroflexaceae bacterium]|jgi:peptide/nickel transport system permease protein|nr:ABC transporter permease [Chloroflexaceae bacterium]